MAAESKSLGRGDQEAPGRGAPAQEARLVARARSGDENAFEELVVMTQDRLYNLTFRMTGSHEDAEDALQETYVRAHRSLSGFEGEAQFFTWIYRIALNACLSKGRKAGRARQVEGLSIDSSAAGDDGSSSLSETFAGSDCPPDEKVSKAERAARVQEAIARLAEEHRSVVVLRDIEGLSYDEIARATDSSRAAVKSRLHRARQRLAEMLEDLR